MTVRDIVSLWHESESAFKPVFQFDGFKEMLKSEFDIDIDEQLMAKENNENKSNH